MKSIAALGSGQGSTIEFFCEKIKKESHPFFIKAIITDKPQSRLLKIAEAFQIPSHVIPYDAQKPNLWDQHLQALLCSYQADLIVLAGFLKKIGHEVIKAFPKKIINSHPSLLPEFGGTGFYGLKVHKAVLKAGKEQTGISIHWVNPEYDKGEILAQIKIPVKKTDTAEKLEKRVKRREKSFYFKTIQNILQSY